MKIQKRIYKAKMDGEVGSGLKRRFTEGVKELVE